MRRIVMDGRKWVACGPAAFSSNTCRTAFRRVAQRRVGGTAEKWWNVRSAGHQRSQIAVARQALAKAKHLSGLRVITRFGSVGEYPIKLQGLRLRV